MNIGPKQKKVRSDAVLKLLPKDRQAALAEFLKTHSLDEGLVKLKKEDIKVSRSTLCDWLGWYQATKRFNDIATRVKAITDAFKSAHPSATDAELFAMGQRIFSEVAIATEDAKTWTGVQSVSIARETLDHRKLADKTAAELKREDQAMTRAELQMKLEKHQEHVAERKAAIQKQLDATRKRGGLRPETIEKIERELKLL